jgi:GTP pyrophosphokinase
MPEMYGPDDFTTAFNKLYESAGSPRDSLIKQRADMIQPKITVTPSLLIGWRQGAVPRSKRVVEFLVTYLSRGAATPEDLRRWEALRAGSERARRAARRPRGRRQVVPPDLDTGSSRANVSRAERGLGHESPLSQYITVARRMAEAHPYPGVLPGNPQPPLSSVYVQQLVQPEATRTQTRDMPIRIPAESVLDAAHDAVLIGGPGSGKTSLMRSALSSVYSRWHNEDTIVSMPVYISAADLVPERPLADLIADGANRELSAVGLLQSWSADFFAAPPMLGVKWLVLVDNFDEVMNADDRRRIITKIAHVGNGERAHRFLIATRRLGINDLIADGGWVPLWFELLPFTTDQLRVLASQWFVELGLHNPTEAAARFLSQIDRIPSTDLTGNPLMATMLCQLFASKPDNVLPSARLDIYNAYLRLLRRRTGRRAVERLAQVTSGFGEEAIKAGERLLGKLEEFVGRFALERQEGAERNAIDSIIPWTMPLRPTLIDPAEWESLVVEVLRHSGLLIQLNNDLRFSHQTIAEYLAARYLNQNPEMYVERIKRVFAHPYVLLAEQQSYTRFLVALSPGWDASRALYDLANDGGIVGGAFIAALIQDGVKVETTSTEAACLRLLAAVTDENVSFVERRDAFQAVLELDPEPSREHVSRLVEAEIEHHSLLRWSITGMAQRGRYQLELLAQVARREGGRSSRIGRSVIQAIAHRGGERGADILYELATNGSLDDFLAAWAAECILDTGDRRGRAILRRIAAKGRSDFTRRWASEALGVSNRDPLTASQTAALHSDVASQDAKVHADFRQLLNLHAANSPNLDHSRLVRAYDLAAYFHDGQYRMDRAAYLSHSIATAAILAELGMDEATLIAAVLHGLAEHTEVSLHQIRKRFGNDVASLVDGVTALDEFDLGEAATAETIRKMVVAIAKDPRVLIIKLADRLHNMRTLNAIPRVKQEQKARETLEILAPLAHRLGMNTLKRELEDLAFATLFPHRFAETKQLVDKVQPQREGLLRRSTKTIQRRLREAGLRATTDTEPPHLYSIYREMAVRGEGFPDVYDLTSVRVLVDSVRDCYGALGVIHANWRPLPGRFKDFIAMPKFNMYRSLHTSVVGPIGMPVEIQIRTVDMQRTADFGIAARWKYKEQENSAIVEQPTQIDEMTWLRQVLDWQREASDPGEFLDALRFDLSSHEVYVFTPKGDVIPLLTGWTPVDFAYAVDPRIGTACIGARVNGELVPLATRLTNGDVVEILTSKSDTAGPSRDWLMFVKSPRARTKIRQHFIERREEAIEAGKESVVQAILDRRLPLTRLLSLDALAEVARELRLPSISSLYAAVGEAHLSPQSVTHHLVTACGGEEVSTTAASTPPPSRRPNGPFPGVEVKGFPDAWIKLARCCTPVPGDMAFGFIIRSGGISVHRDDCANAEDLRHQLTRVVEVTWKPSSTWNYLMCIQIEAFDSQPLLADVTQVLSEEHITILSATVTTTRDRLAISRFAFEIGDPKRIGHILASVRKVPGVFDAYRVTSGA